MKRAFLLLGVLVALGASLASSAGAANAAPAATERLQALDQQVLAALNEARSKHGLRPLVMSDELQDAAVAHSSAMLEKGFFAHDSPSGAPFVARVRGFYRSGGYGSWTVGENLIYNTEELTAAIALAAWMASPGHRENILAPGWREVGIGSLHANSAGGLFAGEPTWVITMDFGARSGKVATKPKVKQHVAKQKAGPKPAAKKTSKLARGEKSGKPSATGKQKAKTGKPSSSGKAKPVKKSEKPKPVDRVLPRPSHEPEDDESDDGADAADESATVPEDDEDEDVADPSDESTDEGDGTDGGSDDGDDDVLEP